jgi:hypothetical protein
MESKFYPMRELAPVIRSKNAKPYLLTLDVVFDDASIFRYVRDSGGLDAAVVARAYGIPVDRIVSSFVFEPGLAFKFTLKRPRVQGALGESDMYGAQQHAPLLDIQIPWSANAPKVPAKP